MYLTLKSVANHEVIARTGWKNDFYVFFFFSTTKSKYIQTEIVGKGMVLTDFPAYKKVTSLLKPFALFFLL